VLGLAGQAEALARGEISSSELVEDSLERIGRREALGAFRVVRSEAAGQEALEAD
jgi:amidase